jgi:hypothetical protein
MVALSISKPGLHLTEIPGALGGDKETWKAVRQFGILT